MWYLDLIQYLYFFNLLFKHSISCLFFNCIEYILILFFSFLQIDVHSVVCLIRISRLLSYYTFPSSQTKIDVSNRSVKTIQTTPSLRGCIGCVCCCCSPLPLGCHFFILNDINDIDNYPGSSGVKLLSNVMYIVVLF